jgi:putative DNA-invertase from lambdoid prophage Rac
MVRDLCSRFHPLRRRQREALACTRVSTSEQTVDHQETMARAGGFAIDEVVSDEGVSGVSVPLAERDQGKRLFDLLRRGDVLVVRGVDRLGRNYSDVTETIRQFMRRGVIVKTMINGMVFDGATKDPMQMAVRDALIGFMAAMARDSPCEGNRGKLSRTQADPACDRARHARGPVRYRRDLGRDRTLASDHLSDQSGPGMGGRAAGALGESRLKRPSPFFPPGVERRAHDLPFRHFPARPVSRC